MVLTLLLSLQGNRLSAQEINPFEILSVKKVGYIVLVKGGKEVKYDVLGVFGGEEDRHFERIGRLEKVYERKSEGYPDNTVLEMSFENVPLEAAIKTLSIVAGINLIVDPVLKGGFEKEVRSPGERLSTESLREEYPLSSGYLFRLINIFIKKPTPLEDVMKMMIRESDLILVPIKRDTYLLTKAIEYKIDITGVQQEALEKVIELIKDIVSPGAEVVIDRRLELIYVRDRYDNLPKLKDLEEKLELYISSVVGEKEKEGTKTKVFYLSREYSVEEVVRILSNQGLPKEVLISKSPEFNAIVVTAKPSLLQRIEELLKPYTASLSEENLIVTKTFYVKFLSAETFKRLIQPLLSEVGEVYVLSAGIASTTAEEKELRQIDRRIKELLNRIANASPEERTVFQQELQQLQRRYRELEQKIQQARKGNMSDIEVSVKVQEDALGPSFDKTKTATTMLSNAVIVRDYVNVVDRIRERYKDIISDEPVQIKIEARIVEVSQEVLRELGVNWSALLSNVRLPEALRGGIGINPDTAGTNIPGLLGSPNTGGILTFTYQGGFLNALNLRLSAYERVNKARSLAKPTVITLNGEPALIQSSIRFPVTTISATQTALTVSATYEDAPLILSVVPVLTPDNKIMLDITLIKKEVIDTVAYNVAQGLTQEFPVFSDNKVDTKVIVNEGDTVVIGGIISEVKQKSDEGIPKLQRLPLLGWLFKEQQISDESRELLIFITPTIVSE